MISRRNNLQMTTDHCKQTCIAPQQLRHSQPQCQTAEAPASEKQKRTANWQTNHFCKSCWSSYTKEMRQSSCHPPRLIRTRLVTTRSMDEELVSTGLATLANQTSLLDLTKCGTHVKGMPTSVSLSISYFKLIFFLWQVEVLERLPWMSQMNRWPWRVTPISVVAYKMLLP